MQIRSVLYFLLCLLLGQVAARGQSSSLDYYFPGIAFDARIPSPQAVLGFHIGEWHLSHDQQVFYLRQLAAASDRIFLEEYGRSHENRPLLLLTVTSPANHRRLEEIRRQHLALSDPENSADLPLDDMPVVVYQGYSIHGNEPSGGNAAVLMAYYLAAAQNAGVEALLDETVVLLDPCFNPDGFQRFAGWVNAYRGLHLNGDAQSRELDEIWPQGRTNHYWFDLNRDWLPAQQPESRGRLRQFHRWRPNVLTDHHEMGSNNTFFFQPGVPQRTNPLTPPENQALTARIGSYHAEALDAIGSLYYTQETYDDFYYGKGSTYPDINGGVGILFEQASSRGHLRQTERGLLSFPFTIRNQVATSLSTLQAAREMRLDLLRYQAGFFREAAEEAKNDPRKAWVFSEPRDPYRLARFVELLERHQIEVFRLAGKVEVDGVSFPAEGSYVVPFEQEQYRLIRAIFETGREFQDSLFYDVSSWTLPFAFGLQYAALDKKQYSSTQLGEPGLGLPAAAEPAYSEYAYLFRWDDYLAPAALYALQQAGLRARVATEPFRTSEGVSFDRGAILVPVQGQPLNPAMLHRRIVEISRMAHLAVVAMPGGFVPEGIDLGSPSFRALSQPRVALLVGDGVTPYDAGEIWHLLDQRYRMPVALLEAGDLHRTELDRYNVVLLPDGNYRSVEPAGENKLREWVEGGGTLIACRDAVAWAIAKKIGYAQLRKPAEEKDPPARPYGDLVADRGAQVIGGAIAQVRIDRTHPLAYGYAQSDLAVFRKGAVFLEHTRNPYANPAVYADSPVLSGYLSAGNEALLRGSAAMVCSGQGKGRVIYLTDDPCFRAFWYGTDKVLANAVFFGGLLQAESLERAPKKEEGK